MKDSIIIEKRVLREDYIEKRKKAIDPEARIADAAIASHVFGADFYCDANSIFIYISVGMEVDTLPIILRAFEDGKMVCVPRTKKNRVMEAVPIEDELLQQAQTEWLRSFGIPEPPYDIPAIDASSLDLTIVPSVALDRWGYRLGYGGGFYDRFIATARKQKKYPVFAAVQRTAFIRNDAIPREPYDMTVDFIITENGIVIPASSA